MSVIKATRKPTVVEAFHFTDGSQSRELKDWLNINGNLLISIGDWVIQTAEGKISVCPPDIFDLTYNYEKSQ